ncbi:S49 family peptidase [Methanophagales archaeon]|nr:MAG: S49 family peptidase [Methanophagales archaeon]
MVIKKRKKLIIVSVLIATILVGTFYILFFLPSDDLEWRIPTNKIAMIEIKGEITEDCEGGANPWAIRKLLDMAEEDEQIKAIVLRINSGGGDAGASWDLYRAVQRVDKPVVASIADTGASGAYLVAVAADEIIATPMSVIGGIGASMEFPFDVPVNASEEAEEMSSMPSGEFKDVFADYRLNESERAYLKERLESVQEVFSACVAESRNISEEDMMNISHGGWFTGEEGLQLGLVDKTGNLEDAIEEAAELANVSLKDTKVVTLRIEGSRVRVMEE